ncbi:hypothetical protein FRB93_012775 [Tulasnella sp. JGI-2019a]|nr:hypothetical protein FRB93_012775 [Tulasnella sp. JGI-2019a]
MEGSYDPISMNFKQQANLLLSRLPTAYIPPNLLPIITQASNGVLKLDELLPTLSRLLAIPAFTLAVLDAFLPVLVDLTARWLDDETIDEVRRLEALSLLLENHEEIHPVVANFLQRPSLAQGPLGFLNSSSVSTVPVDSLHRILLLYYRLLRAAPEIPQYYGWSVEHLDLLMGPPHSDPGVRYLALRCYALHLGLSEQERDERELALLGPVAIADVPIQYGGVVSEDMVGIETKWIDGWLLPLMEVTRVADYRQALAKPISYFENTKDQAVAEGQVLSPRVANVSGVLLVRQTTQPIPASRLVETPSTKSALHLIALHFSRRIPTLISAPAGSGKSLLIHHLASLLYTVSNAQNQILTIYLSDTSLDPKTLLGSYISSPTRPGNFEWVEGALVRAMRLGKWVVLKDIDKASGEVLGTLLPLIESLGYSKGIAQRAYLDISGRGRIEAADSFALFATRSVVPTAASADGALFPQSTFLGSQHWFEVQATAPSQNEQHDILSKHFPKLAGESLRALLEVWEAAQSGWRGMKKGPVSAGTPREIGLRDLEKWIQRVDRLLPATVQPMIPSVENDGSQPLSTRIFSPSVREEIFLEAKDVLFGSIPSSSSIQSAFVHAIGEKLGLTDDRILWAIKGRTPEYETENNPSDGSVVAIRIGRTRLTSHPVSSRSPSASLTRPFALHKPSLKLLEQLSTAVGHAEPLLLVGETGTGKTTAIQHIASLLNRPLVAINLSNQTESADLLGGYKPLDPRVPAGDLQSRFLALFEGTFSIRKNEAFVGEIRKAVSGAKWKRCVGMWKEGCGKAKARFGERLGGLRADPVSELNINEPRKRRKVEDVPIDAAKVPSLDEWLTFEQDIIVFEAQHVLAKSKFVFTFVEGPLVRAVRAGHWVLLDEINLASPETLESITPLLQSSTSSITLTEQGSLTPVPRHPSFRIFASMNPATDVGKKDLPPNLRTRFTELWVPPPDDDRDALLAIITQYIGHCVVGSKSSIMDVADFYAGVRRLAEERAVADGSNKRAHFSMRTLARALTFAADVTPSFGLRRGLWEGCMMAFTMSLDEKSVGLVTPLAEKHLLAGVKNIPSLLSVVPAYPKGRTPDEFVQVGPFWLSRGPLPLQAAEDYILTPSVQKKLIDLSRIILTGRSPVLIEGPTSAGKTSAIEYLARRTGHRFIRINNHEHTDVQEYLGSYVSDPNTGRLVFQDGLLVRALRNGDWIVLDELNLAPTDVLEALNRLLDDNRELLLPETQEVVRPHPQFMLFATQNPAGLYAGRKTLSRAFRNRFLEVHFDDVPQAELERILSERCQIALSRAQRIVSVFHELQKRRQAGRLFETKQSFATLRDLFRWAGRDWKDKEEQGNQSLAEAGYMLLAERARRPDDKAVVKEVIEKILNVRIDEDVLYSLGRGDVMTDIGVSSLPSSNLVWTTALRRLFVLLVKALKHNEPVLLVGETGSGKTSICEYLAKVKGQTLYMLNCHQNTETADLLGSQRPIRNQSVLTAEIMNEASEYLRELGVDVPHDVATNPDLLISTLAQTRTDKSRALQNQQKLKDLQRRIERASALFEWHDGPIITAMQNDGIFLLDEISLADDSVLERLNSVLEPQRSIVLAEKGGWDLDHVAVTASPGFQIIATMNPGGDYGKKELSPALRNRFTEIWVPQIESRADKAMIIDNSWKHDDLKPYTSAVLDFCEWFSNAVGDTHSVGLRDILSWVGFSNEVRQGLAPPQIFHDAARMTLMDGLASLPQTSSMSISAIRGLQEQASKKLASLVPIDPYAVQGARRSATGEFTIGSFGMTLGPSNQPRTVFNLEAPTTNDNAMRVLRACQVRKPILLEGSPGVGKTSLITALASVCRYNLCRINLSDQTDLMDLFGSDLPVEGGKPGEFVWKDAPFLRALQGGDWVLLDEMNLAPQAILEGLNAVLDHRGTVYIPELGRTFGCHPNFRVFAAQNPLKQGGARKGLPKSFLNRFTKVYIQELSAADLLLICSYIYPDHPSDEVRQMITFNVRLQEEVMTKRTFGREGSAWEFNLRDILRWLSLRRSVSGLELHNGPAEHVRSVYIQRFRNSSDRDRVWRLFSEVFSCSVDPEISPHHSITSRYIQWGHHLQPRSPERSQWARFTPVLHSDIGALEAISDSVNDGSLIIVSGPPRSGKTRLIRQFSQKAGVRLHEIGMHPAVDTADLLGSFEQVGQVDATGSRIGLTSAGRFQWVDGPLVEAMECGHWLLLDNANLCNSSVLDRLNSLCETNGSLVLSERGLVNGEVQILRPHPTFRLFMAMDPRHGELSRAMRNRGVEIALTSSDIDDADASLLACESRSLLINSSRQSIWSFEARRRGVHSLEDQAILSSTRLVTRDCQAAYLLSILHLTRTCLVGGDGIFSAISEYVIRSMPPSLSRLVQRAMLPSFGWTSAANLAFIRLLCSAAYLRVQGVSESWKTDLEITRGVPSAFLSEQPIDVLLNPNLVESDKPYTGSNSTVVLRVVELLVASSSLVLSSQSAVSGQPITVLAKSIAIHHGKLSADDAAKGLVEMYPLLAAIDQATDKLLSHLEGSLKDLAHCVPILQRLAAYGQHMKGVISRREVDYSSINAIVHWIVRLIPKSFSIFSGIERAATSLKEAIKITNGHGMYEIWLDLLLPSSINVMNSLRELDALTTNLGPRQSSSALRHNAFDLMAVLNLTQQKDEPYLVEISQLVTNFTQLQTGARVEASLTDSACIAVNELTTLSTWRTGAKNQSIGELLRLALDSPGYPILRLTPWRHVEWQFESAPAVTAKSSQANFSAVLSWLTSLWSLGSPAHEESTRSGPACLLQPHLLRQVLREYDWTGQGLAHLSSYEPGLERLSRFLVLEQQQMAVPRVRQILAILVDQIHLLFHAFRSSWEGSTYDGIVNCLEGWKMDVLLGTRLSPPSTYLTVATSSTNEHVARVFGELLLPALLHLSTATSPGVAVSKCFIVFAQVITTLYVPDTPLDPMVAQQCALDFWKNELNSLNNRIQVNLAAEKLATGNDVNPTLRLLKERKTEIEMELQDVHIVAVDRPPNVERLHALHAEISRFCHDVANWSNLEALATSLERSEVEASLREDMLQGSIAGFLQRIEATYQDQIDITRPFVYACELLRFGMRMLAESGTTNMEASSLSEAAGALATFPPQISAIRLQDIDLSLVVPHTSRSISPAVWLLLSLRNIAEDAAVDMSPRRCGIIEERYDQLLQLWLADREQDRKEALEAGSLYRPAKRDVEALGDDEEPERELRELFPRYEDADSELPPSPQNTKVKRNLSPDVQKDVYELHMHLFGGKQTIGSGASSSATVANVLGQLLSNAHITERIDEDSVSFRLALVAQRCRSLNTPDDWRIPNFYLAPNVLEVRKCVVLLDGLIKRLAGLISEWPDQMVLHNLRENAESILQLEIHSPVAKVLSALERLLMLSEDWERYANRDNSLRSQQQALTALIVEWRRLELQCWSRLLEDQALAFSSEVSTWWFRLHESIIRGSLGARVGSDGDQSEDYILQLSPLLDQFIHSSPIGQFRDRLQLLRSFAAFGDSILSSKSKGDRIYLSRVLALVRNTHAYWAQFETLVASHLQKQRDQLEKKILDFIKLASWKDVNVHALKASAEKTHRQLHICIVKFRQVLRQPVEPLLIERSAGDGDPDVVSPTPVVFFAIVPNLLGSASGPDQIDHQEVLNKMSKLLSSRLKPFVCRELSSPVDSLAADIIDTVQSLASTLVGGESAEDRAKAVKALTSRKRKAMADFMKSLREAGLPQNVKPDVLDRHQSRPWVMEQPRPWTDDQRSVVANLLSKAEDYHHRINHRLPKLRLSLGKHHDDISTRDLQRGILFVESSLEVALSTRSKLQHSVASYAELQQVARRFSSVVPTDPTTAIAECQAKLTLEVTEVHSNLCRLAAALGEIERGAAELIGSEPGLELIMRKLSLLRNAVEMAKANITNLNQKMMLTRQPILLSSEHAVLNDAREALTAALTSLEAWGTERPEIYHMCHATVGWLGSVIRAPISPAILATATTPSVHQSSSASTAVVNAILIITQNLLALSESSNLDDKTPPDDFIRQHDRVLRKTSELLRADAVLKQVDDLLNGLMNANADQYKDFADAIARISPFLEGYLAVYTSHLIEYARWCKTVYKLTFVLCSTLQTVAEKGFCKPQESEDGGEDGGKTGTEKMEDGTGLGEGKGEKNVSEEITDESQVEGLQGEDEQEQERDKGKDDKEDDEEDKAIEMSNDMGGEMEDVEKPDEEDRGKDGEENQEEEHEEQIGELDPLDPSAVDEKLWGNEKGDDKNQQMETAQEPSKDDQDNGNEEMVAREEDQPSKEQERKEKKSEEKDDRKGEDKDGEEKEEEEGPDIEDNAQPDLGARLDDHVAESDALELPDDLKMDEDDAEGRKDDDMEMADDLEGDDLPEEDIEADGKERHDSDDGSATEDFPEKEDQQQTELVENGEKEEPPKEGLEDVPPAPKPDMDRKTANDVSASAAEKEQGSAPDEGAAQDHGAESSFDQKHPDPEVKEDGEETSQAADRDERSDPPKNSGEVGDEGDDGTDGAVSSHRTKPQSDKQTQSKPPDIPNPLRNLGDALKEIRRRFQDILESSREENAPEKTSPDNGEQQRNDKDDDMQLEYLQHDEEQEEMQALGPAGPEEATKLRDLKISEDEPPPSTHPPMPQDVDMEDLSAPQPALPQDSLHNPPTSQKDASIDQALTESQIRGGASAAVDETMRDDREHNLSKTERDVEQELAEAQVEVQLRQWQAAGQPEDGADQMWRLYESLTHDLSYALCEQLRLILEPTLATRLKGDYRTGKRLNMKKIIPYIASEFTKDKIWLRRTRPSQREYQVLIALDDSKSMAESHSVHLAFETLALVSKALSRLEVGDVGIVRFGKMVEVVHGFDQGGPFSDASGAKVMGAFKFNQTATDVLALLETSLKVLREAREKKTMASTTAANLWQLQIIVSDGICQDHERLRAVLRRAEEQRVMIVFVIVDSLQRTTQAATTSSSAPVSVQNSILTMNQVSYKNVNGRMELKMERYLDTFPFEYFVVLRDVEALPEVLAGTLKQFFERSSAE